MWIFSKNGHLAIGQHASDHGYLVVHAQVREDMENLVAMLDEAGVGRHEIQETVEGDYRFFLVARRSAVAEAVGKMVVESITGSSCIPSMWISGQTTRLLAVAESHWGCKSPPCGIEDQPCNASFAGRQWNRFTKQSNSAGIPIFGLAKPTTRDRSAPTARRNIWSLDADGEFVLKPDYAVPPSALRCGRH